MGIDSKDLATSAGEVNEEEIVYVVEGEEPEDTGPASSSTAESTAATASEEETAGAVVQEEHTADDEDEDEDDDEHPSNKPNVDDTPEEVEAKRARRRTERARRKQHAKEREEGYRREIASLRAAQEDLRARLAGQDNRNHASDLARVDDEIRKADNNYAYYRDQIRIATEAGNGAAVAEATDKMLEARVVKERLASLRDAVAKRATPSDNAAVSPTVSRLANEWVKRNSWYNPDPRQQDVDSHILRQLDNSVSQRFRPDTQEYWDELDALVKKYLPHRAARVTVARADEQSDPLVTEKPSTRGKKAVVPTPDNSRSARSVGSTKGNKPFVLSKERKNAMVEAGMWDDPKQRNAMIKKYQAYDLSQAENGN